MDYKRRIVSYLREFDDPERQIAVSSSVPHPRAGRRRLLPPTSPVVPMVPMYSRILIASLLLFLGACTTPDADRIYVNGTFWTGNPDQPSAEAMAVADGRILSVGTENEVRSHAGSTTEVVDLDGAFVVPGFIDNHTHFLSGGLGLASVDLRDASSPAMFSERMAAFAPTIPAGRWIEGGDWDHEAWGGQLPDRSWIDEGTPENPVFVSRLDGHMALANTLALEQAGITADTPDPDGGTIVRRADGTPTGVLKDAAMDLVWAVIPPKSVDERLDMLRRGQEHALAQGVTQIHDVGSYGGWRDLEAFEAAHEAGELDLRVYSLVAISTWQRMADRVAEMGRGDERLRWGGLKGMVDGSLGSTTALFYEPYLDEPGTSGLLVNDTTKLHKDILAADSAGLHLAVHAIGDKANDWLMDVFAEAEAANGPRDRRWRIEHAQHLTRKAIDRFDDLGVVPSMQPYHAIDDGRWAVNRIGEERIKTTYAFRSLLDAGAPLTFGSDWTVAPIQPLLGIYAAVTRRTIDGANPGGWVPEEKITVEEALTAYTISNARAGFWDASTGSLEAGKWADFVILSDNLLSMDPVGIQDVHVLQTVIGGETVYSR